MSTEVMGAYSGLALTVDTFDWLGDTADIEFGAIEYIHRYILKNKGEFEDQSGDYNRFTTALRREIAFRWTESAMSDFDQVDKLLLLIQLNEPIDIFLDIHNPVNLGTVTIDGTGSPITMTTTLRKDRKNKYVGQFVKIMDKSDSSDGYLMITSHVNNSFILEDKLEITSKFLIDANYSTDAEITFFRARIKADRDIEIMIKELGETGRPPGAYEFAVEEIRNWINK